MAQDLKVYQELANVYSGNISNQGTVNGVKKDGYTFSEVYNQGASSTVSLCSKSDMDKQGVVSHAPGFNFVVRNGLVPVSTLGADGKLSSLKEVLFVNKSVICKVNENGYVEVLGGDNKNYLLGYKGDIVGAGYRDLDKIRIDKNALSDPQVTTKVNISAMIDPNKLALKGAGQSFSPYTGKINSGVERKGLLMPETVDGNRGSLLQGTRWILNSGGNAATTVEYGGIAITNSVKVKAIFGANDSSSTFKTAVNGNATGLVDGAYIQIKVEGESATYKLSFAINMGTGNQKVSDNEYKFNSMSSLAGALKDMGFYAQEKEGRIYIANKEAKGIKFDGSDAVLMQGLGLVNVPDAVANVQRFCDMARLSSIINSNRESGVEASSDGKTIPTYIGASSALESLTMNSTSRVSGAISWAFQGDSRDSQEGVRAASSISINSPKHGLQTGDFIRFDKKIGAQLVGPVDGLDANSVCMVQRVDDDNFTVQMISEDPILYCSAVNGVPIAGVAGTKWEKVPGKAEVEKAATAVVTGAGQITITSAAHGYVAGDVVWISGLGKLVDNPGGGNNIVGVPDGYYIVAVGGITGNTFTITGLADVTAAVFAAAGPGRFSGVTAMNTTGGANFAARPCQMRRVSRDASNAGVVWRKGGGNTTAALLSAHTLSQNVLTVDATAALNTVTENGINYRKIKLPLQSHTYKKGDKVVFKGLNIVAPATAINIDNAALSNDVGYKVFEVGADGTITIMVPETGATIAAAPGVIKYGAELGDNFSIESYTEVYKYLSLENEKTFSAKYVAGDEQKGLFSDKIEQKAVYKQNITVYAPNGTPHEFQMRIAKIADNKWAVEVAGIPGDNGEYDFNTSDPKGIVSKRVLTFNPDGSYVGSSDETAISVLFNGSGQAIFNLNFKGDDSFNGIRQAARDGESSDTLGATIVSDGSPALTIVSSGIGEYGNVYVQYSDGTKKTIAIVPALVVTSVDELQGAGAFFRYIGTSIKLEQIGVYVKLMSEAVETDKSDVSSEITALNDALQRMYLNASVVSKELHNDEKVINALVG